MQMNKDIEKKGFVKARSLSTMRGLKPKVEFYPDNPNVATHPRIRREDIFDVNDIVRFKEK